MADEPHPGFPVDETIFVVTVPLQLAEGGSVSARYVASAATLESSARASAYEQWQKHYPDYLAGQPHVWTLRRRLPAKSALFWGGFFVGLAALPGILAMFVLAVSLFHHLASAGEAGTATTPKIGVVHEHATAEGGDAQRRD